MAKRKTKLQKLIESDNIVKECYELTLKHFKGDGCRTDLWFRIYNPFLKNTRAETPMEMIEKGEQKQLLVMIKEATNEYVCSECNTVSTTQTS